jgi:hypothetical protein
MASVLPVVLSLLGAATLLRPKYATGKKLEKLPTIG